MAERPLVAAPLPARPPADRGARGLIRRAAGLAPTSAVGPVAVLFGLNLVDEFDRIAFTTLTPEIRDAFGLTDTQIASVGLLTGLFLLLASMPLGVIADRANRIRLVTVAATLWASMSILTGVVPTLALLFVVRFLAGLGRAMNEIVHPTLLTDLYSPAEQPSVFALHRMANPLSALTAVVAGAVGALLGWQWAFFLLAIPTIPLIVAARRIPEPVRGGGPAGDAGTADDGSGATGAPPVRESVRALLRVRTLRRLWLAAFILGTAIAPVALLVTFYLEDEHGLGPLGRGAAQVVMGVGTIVGLVAGGRIAQGIAPADAGGVLARQTGRWLSLAAVGIVLAAVAPSVPAVMAAFVVVGLGIGGYQPVLFPLVGRVTGPHIRALAFGSVGLAVGVGALGALGLLAIGESTGYRVALVAAGVLGVVAGLIVTSAERLVVVDVDAQRHDPSTTTLAT